MDVKQQILLDHLHERRLRLAFLVLDLEREEKYLDDLMEEKKLPSPKGRGVALLIWEIGPDGELFHHDDPVQEAILVKSRQHAARLRIQSAMAQVEVLQREITRIEEKLDCLPILDWRVLGRTASELTGLSKAAHV